MKFDFSIPGYTLAKACMGDALMDLLSRFLRSILPMKRHWLYIRRYWMPFVAIVNYN